MNTRYRHPTVPSSEHLKKKPVTSRLLVVDDEVRNRLLLSALLSSEGYEVMEAANGAQALGMVAELMPDAILLDVMMPGMSGFEVCAKLKADATTAHIPVLLVTVLEDRDSRLRGIAAGAMDFLSKPVDREELRLRVRNAVYTKRLHDQLQHEIERLRELEQLRDNLIHMIVHDMKTPLAAVQGSLELIKLLIDREKMDPRVTDCLDTSYVATRELVQMATSLLDVKRLEEGKMPLNRTEIDLAKVARFAAAGVRVLAASRQVRLDIQAETQVMVYADPELTGRVIGNLLSNAIKFSPENETVCLRLTGDEAGGRVEVKDSGCGIAPEHHERIFERFAQAAERPDGMGISTGLGLTFCKLAVSAHNGRIGVDSAAGKGSVFWFWLPAEETAAS
jgi:two-component system sensor histidine kinase/response regulator